MHSPRPPRPQRDDRPRFDRPQRDDRPRGDRPQRDDRPRGDRPQRDDRPRFERPREDHPPHAPSVPVTPARHVADAVLRGLLDGEAFLQPTLASEAAKAQLSDLDRRLATELVLGVSRLWGRLCAELNELLREDMAKLPPDVQRALALGHYQLTRLDIPPHAAVNESVELTKRASPWAMGIVNRVLKTVAEEGAPALTKLKGDELLSAELSHPRWWIRSQLRTRSLEEVRALAEANNRPAPLSVRPHVGHSADELRAALEAEGAKVTPARWVEGAFYLDHPHPFSAPSFRKGLWFAQDEASQLVAELVGARAGDRVWDVCAAPGGKSLALVEAVGEGGWVLATELHERKAADLKERLAPYAQATTLQHDASAGLPDDLRAPDGALAEGSFDAVLLDAPCTALGVVRRHPEVRWRRTVSDVQRAAKRQISLLHAVAFSVRVGGHLVYSVCTDTPEETTEVVSQFLLAYPEFVIASPPDEGARWGALMRGGALSINPAEHNTDGFYAVRLLRVR
jgi:16S rRNA (cytosine967-C5)-methyltransferase